MAGILRRSRCCSRASRPSAPRAACVPVTEVTSSIPVQAMPDAFLNERSEEQSRRHGTSVEYTKTISPSVVNVALVGFSRTLLISGNVTDVLNPAISDKTLGFVPGLDIGSIVVPGLTSLSAGPTALDKKVSMKTQLPFSFLPSARFCERSLRDVIRGGTWPYGASLLERPKSQSLCKSDSGEMAESVYRNPG